MKNIRIGKADGPTSVFILKKNAKLTLKQKFQKLKSTKLTITTVKKQLREL